MLKSAITDIIGSITIDSHPLSLAIISCIAY